jgi:hypothetical protein
MDADDSEAPPIAVEAKDGGMSVTKVQTEKGTIPLGRTGQGGPPFVASMRALV